MNETTISTIVELPEALHLSAQKFLKEHPQWSEARLNQAAMSLFLMQNGANDQHVNSLYLNSLFGYQG